LDDGEEITSLPEPRGSHPRKEGSVRSQLVKLLLSLARLNELPTELSDFELESLVLAERPAVARHPGEEVADRMEDGRDASLDRCDGVSCAVSD